MSGHFDVLIIGAGISGIGAACHLKEKRPQTTFAVIEGRDQIGGTWSLFRYPGIRSDSDMQTFGFGFKPWDNRKALAGGDLIVDYLKRTIDAFGVGPHIRLGEKVVSAEFSSADALWTVTVRRNETDSVTRYTSRFLFLGTGYYDYDKGHTPDFAGVGDFGGRVVHPQFWPEDLDYSGKRVVVIGSGATAVTLVPSMADKARHVTMLQRSPTYIMSIPAEDAISNGLNRLFGGQRAHGMIRTKNIFLGRTLFKLCRRWPKQMRKFLIANVRRQLPKTFDVETHFSPAYDPWDQRLCFVPDGDLFKALSSGKASVVTDRIERFTPTGLLLESGQELAADIVVTATGLNMSPFGKIAISVDGRRIKPNETTLYKAMMLSGVPNLVAAFGYTNLSWTLKVDLICAHFCRLLDHMEAKGYELAEPVLDDPSMQRVPAMDLAAGYVQRAIAGFPHAGVKGPWTVEHAYEKDVARLLDGPIEDSALKFSSVRRLRLVA